MKYNIIVQAVVAIVVCIHVEHISARFPTFHVPASNHAMPNTVKNRARTAGTFDIFSSFSLPTMDRKLATEKQTTNKIKFDTFPSQFQRASAATVSSVEKKFNLFPNAFKKLQQIINNAAKGSLSSDKLLKTANDKHDKARYRLFNNIHLYPFRRLNEANSETPSWVCTPIPNDAVGQSIPGNYTIYFPDGHTKVVAPGDFVTSEMVGGTACPCYNVPEGSIAPVDGVWEGITPIPAGARADSPGRFCVKPVDFSQSNICKNPKNFNPNAVYDSNNNTCAILSGMCHGLRKDGGIIPSYLPYIVGMVPICCNGTTEYNDDSGCGTIEVEHDYCDGGEYDPDHTVEFECRSPVERDNNPAFDEQVEECHTEECKKSAIGCIAARGKENEHHSGKIYSMQLEPREVKCSERVPYYCGMLSGTLSPTGAPQGMACSFVNEDNSTGVCFDANCHKSEEECLSRAGTTNAVGQTYPARMVYTSQAATKPDVNDHTAFMRLNSHYSGMKQIMNDKGCCKTGSYKDACLFSELKQKIEETTPNLKENNICKNPNNFNPNGLPGDACTLIAQMCHRVRNLGGLNPNFLNLYMKSTYVPNCCNGTTEYNDDSGCGTIEVEHDYCDGGEYDPDHTVEFECRSPVERDNNPAFDEQVEECHTEECKKSAIGCIAARGKENEHHSGKIYSMQLEPREVKCSERVPYYCGMLSGTLSPTGAWPGMACSFVNEEGDTEYCFDANCHKSEEECLSRAGTVDAIGRRIYPSTMVYKASPKLDTNDPATVTTFRAHLSGMKHYMNTKGCCKTGTYKNECASPELMQALTKHSLCKDPTKFDPTGNVNGYYMCHHTESCAAKLLERGICFNPNDPQDECRDQREENGKRKGCRFSEEDCSEIRPGFKFTPFTHAHLAYSSFESRSHSQICCADGQINDLCDIGKDSFLEEPSIGMCKDMAFFRPDAIYDDHNSTCGSLNWIVTMRRIFYKGKCGEMEGGYFREKCHEGPCSASKEICESKGYTFQPYTEEEVQRMNSMVSIRMSEQCCGNANNLGTFYSMTKYIKDGSPAAPGSCMKDTCCGKGTVWKDGFGCIPTRSGIVDACKKARGKWGWTCENEEVCA